MNTTATSTISVAAFLEIAKEQAHDLSYRLSYEISINGIQEIKNAFNTLHYVVCPIVFKAEGEDRAELIKQWKAEEKAFEDACVEAFNRISKNH